MTESHHSQEFRLKAAIAQAKELFDALLRQQRRCKVYDFLPIINRERLYPWSSEPLVALYQKQYIIQSTLIELQEDYRLLNQTNSGLKEEDREESYVLDLDSVNVSLQPYYGYDTDGYTQALEADAAQIVLEHYRDYRRFFSATSDTVAKLLESFWVEFNCYNQQDEAFFKLGLTPQATWDEVKTAYRALASKNHPDKGGEQAEFIAIRHAYEALRKVYQAR